MVKGSLFPKRSTSGKAIQAFTLVEVIVVMGILAVLMGIVWSGFYGLRTAMALHQTAESFRSDVVYAQRSAMLLKRNPGENYVRGILLDLRELQTPPTGETPQYSIRKWCSIGRSYLDFDTTSTIPVVVAETCTNEFLGAMGYEHKKLAGGDLDVCITHKNQSLSLPDIQAVLFESVNGRPHFYRLDGSGENFINVDNIYENGNTSNVRVAFYWGDRWDSVIIHLDGKIELETWDPADTTPCGN